MSSEDIDDNDSNNKNNSSSNINANNTKVATLKVAEVAEQHDVGRKIARVDPDVAERLGISTGDALELSSLGKKTIVLSWPARGER